jgi:hypothetical protein
MGVLGELKGPIAGLFLSVLLGIGVILIGLLQLVNVITGPDPTLGALLTTLITYLIVLVVVALIALAFVAWGLYRAVNAFDADSDVVQNRYVQMGLSKFGGNRWARRLGIASVASSAVGGSGPSGHQGATQHGGQQHGGQNPGQQTGGQPGQRSGSQPQTGGQNPGQQTGGKQGQDDTDEGDDDLPPGQR